MKVRKFERFSLKLLRCKARERKSQYTTAYQGLIDLRALRSLEAPEDATRACIASRMLSSSVVSPRQTARAGKRPLKLNPVHQ